jgi:hypothetical protein
MQKQIDSEPPPVPVGPDGQPLDQGEEEQQPEATPEDYPPEDNVSEKDSNESSTPELDKQVQKFSKVINMK